MLIAEGIGFQKGCLILFREAEVHWQDPWLQSLDLEFRLIQRRGSSLR